MDTSTHDTPEIDAKSVAEGIPYIVAFKMALTQAQVRSAFALSSWTTIEEMVEREFAGAYRGYFPKCGMEIRAEAVIAEVFDQIAINLGDPRRSLRSGTWTPPSIWMGGHSDG